MSKLIAFALTSLALIAGPLFGQTTSNIWKGPPPPIVIDYDVDSTSYFYPVYCTPSSGSSTLGCGPGTSPMVEKRLITTSGASSTTVTGVTHSAFSAVSAGDLILVTVNTAQGALSESNTYLRKVTAKASASSITINTAITIPTAGVGFSWWKLTAGSGTESGWFDCSSVISQNMVIGITQISVTGGIDYTLEGRLYLGGGLYSAAATIVATTNKTAVSATPAGWSLSGTGQGPWSQCRVGLKVGTADDDGVTFGASSDDIDFKEYTNSYSPLTGHLDIDFTEDPAGTPKVCTARLTAASAITGAAVATDATTKMNAAACTPDNTYLASYSTTTHKFTIARATGTKAVSILWNSGTNNATAADTLLGFAADVTGATTYTGVATGESAEKTASLTDGLYLSGTTACVEVASKMQAASGVGNYSCAYDTTADKVTISATGITQLMILWASGTNNATSADTPLGFSADSTGALTYEGSALGSDASDEIEKVTISVAGYK